MDHLLEKWRSRLFSIVIPYGIWSSIYYLYFVFLTQAPFIHRFMNREKVPFSLLEWLEWLWPQQYYTLWFLKDLIVYIALTPLIYGVLKDRGKILIGLAVLTGVILLTTFHIGSPFLSDGLSMYLAGAYIGINHKELLKIKPVPGVSVVAIVYILFQIVTCFAIWNLWCNLIFNVAVWLALDLLDLGNINLPWWMSITFFVYMAHDMILEALEKVVMVLLNPNWVVILLTYLLTPIMTYAICVCIASIMRKRIPRVWRVISGGR